jgi:hypothetical protein
LQFRSASRPKQPFVDCGLIPPGHCRFVSSRRTGLLIPAPVVNICFEGVSAAPGGRSSPSSAPSPPGASTSGMPVLTSTRTRVRYWPLSSANLKRLSDVLHDGLTGHTGRTLQGRSCSTSIEGLLEEHSPDTSNRCNRLLSVLERHGSRADLLHILDHRITVTLSDASGCRHQRSLRSRAPDGSHIALLASRPARRAIPGRVVLFSGHGLDRRWDQCRRAGRRADPRLPIHSRQPPPQQIRGLRDDRAALSIAVQGVGTSA